MTRYCINCGAKFDDDIAFCPECGQKIAPDDQANDSVQLVNNNGQNMQQVTQFNDGSDSLMTNSYSTSNDVPNSSPPGKGLAIASLVLGIVSLVFVFLFPLAGLVTGIVGIICATKAKSSGYSGGMQTAGFVCSLIGLIINGFFFVACVACAGMFGAAGTLGK